MQSVWQQIWIIEVIYSVVLGGIRFGSFGIPTNMREGQAILG